MKRWYVSFILVAILLLILAIDSGFILVWRFFALSLLLPLLTYTWARLGIWGIESHVANIPDECQADKSFDYSITINNRSRLPKPLVEVQEDTDVPGHQSLRTFGLSASGLRQWNSTVFCKRRGRYRIGRVIVTHSDPLGLFSIKRTLGKEQIVLIYPATVELPFFSLLSHGDGRHSLSRWSGIEIGTDAAHIREYAAGDSFKHVHWRSTAHAGKLMVKVFDPERFASSSKMAKTIWIAVDMHHLPHYENNGYSTEESCITIAASIAKKYIEKGARVGLIASGDQSYFIPVGAGIEQLWHILKALALVRARGNVPVEYLLNTNLDQFGTKSTVIVITPSTDLKLVNSFHQIVGRELMAIAIVVDPVSFGGTVSATPLARRLITHGTTVYLVKSSERLATALDSRTSNLKYSERVF